MRCFHVVLATVGILSAATVAHATVPTVYVDDGGSDDGNGSFDDPVRTIQGGIDLLPAAGPGVIGIFPGTYLRPDPITRPNTVFQGRAQRVLVDGYLDHFVRLPEDVDEPDDEVVITTDRLLRFPSADNPEPEDLFEVQADRVELYDVVLDSGGFFHNFLNAAFSAKAEGQDHYVGIVAEGIIVRGTAGQASYQVPFDTPIWPVNADAHLGYITLQVPSFVGMNPTGSGHYLIEHVDLANAETAICFLGRWVLPVGENPPSNLVAEFRDSRISDGRVTFGVFPETRGLLILGRGGRPNPDVRSNENVTVSNVTIENVDVGIYVQAWGLASEGGVSGGLINASVEDVSLSGNGEDTRVSFLPLFGPSFVNDTTIIVHSNQPGLFGAADTGPAELNDHYILVE